MCQPSTLAPSRSPNTRLREAPVGHQRRSPTRGGAKKRQFAKLCQAICHAPNGTKFTGVWFSRSSNAAETARKCCTETRTTGRRCTRPTPRPGSASCRPLLERCKHDQTSFSPCRRVAFGEFRRKRAVIRRTAVGNAGSRSAGSRSAAARSAATWGSAVRSGATRSTAARSAATWNTDARSAAAKRRSPEQSPKRSRMDRREPGLVERGFKQLARQTWRGSAASSDPAGAACGGAPNSISPSCRRAASVSS